MPHGQPRNKITSPKAFYFDRSIDESIHSPKINKMNYGGRCLCPDAPRKIKSIHNERISFFPASPIAPRKLFEDHNVDAFEIDNVSRRLFPLTIDSDNEGIDGKINVIDANNKGIDENNEDRETDAGRRTLRVPAREGL